MFNLFNFANDFAVEFWKEVIIIFYLLVDDSIVFGLRLEEVPGIEGTRLRVYRKSHKLYW